MSDKKALVSALESDASSVEQLFSLYFFAAALATSLRWAAHILTEAGWQPMLFDGVVAAGLFVFWSVSRNERLVERLVEVFLLSVQVGIAVLWLFFMPVYEVVPPIALLVIFLYLLVNQGAYLMWTVVGSFIVVVVALFLQWFPQAQLLKAVYSNGDWQLYTLLTLCISTGAIIVLTFVYQRVIKEREFQLAQNIALERARNEAEQKRDLFAQLRALQSDFFLEEDLQLRFDRLLQQLLEFTESRYGFLAEVSVNEAQEVVDMKIHTSVYNEQFGALSEAQQQEHLEATFQRVVEACKPVIDNNPRDRSSQVPVFDITNYLSLPVMYHYDMVGHVLVTNRAGGYKKELIEELEPFLSTYGSILRNIQLKRAQRAYEKQLRQAKEKAEQNDRLKSQFLTNISHELRTPLSLIMGPIAILQKQSIKSINEATLKQYLETIDRNSKNMLAYLEDILDLAQLDAAKLNINERTIDGVPLLERAYSAYKREAEERGMTYELVADLPAGIQLTTDTEKLEKILDNLLSNAFKYTKNKGRVQLQATQRDQQLLFTIEDTGRGIPSEAQAQIFNRFYQVEHSNERIFSGTGLGLALCQELATLLGYEIQVESEVGKGSRFTVVIPASKWSAPKGKPHQQDIATIEPAVVPKERPCLLVAEDHRDMRLFLEQILSLDYDVFLTENGRQAWEELQSHPTRYDLLITDLMMPEMDGYDLLEKVHAQEWAAQLPIIVLTAKAQFDTRLGNLRIGMDDYLTKPFEVSELLATVQYLLRNRVFE